MCGIAGFWRSNNNQNGGLLEEIVSNMTNTLVHRGPDERGTWVDEEVRIAFGHSRLSIIDVSNTGTGSETSYTVPVSIFVNPVEDAFSFLTTKITGTHT